MPAQTAKGPAAIAAFLRARYGGGQDGLSADGLSSMFIDNPLVNLSADGNSAKARWNALIFHGHDGKARIEGGIFENDYVLDGGVWKIAAAHYYPAIRRALRGGLDQLGRRRPADRSPSLHRRYVRHSDPTRHRHRAADQGDARRTPEAGRRAQRRGSHPQSPVGLRLLRGPQDVGRRRRPVRARTASSRSAARACGADRRACAAGSRAWARPDSSTVSSTTGSSST